MILASQINTDMWRLIFPILGAILFAAHLYFWGSYFWLAVPVILLILLIIPFRPVCWLWQLSLIGFGIEWFYIGLQPLPSQNYIRHAICFRRLNSDCLRTFNYSVFSGVLQRQNQKNIILFTYEKEL